MKKRKFGDENSMPVVDMPKKAGMKKGGAVKCYAYGGTVRGTGAATKASKKCKIY